jgi:hypothetical protein
LATFYRVLQRKNPEWKKSWFLLSLPLR